MKAIEDKLKTLETELQQILNQIANLDKEEDFIIMMKQRERYVGAIEILKKILEETKEDNNANDKSS